MEVAVLAGWRRQKKQLAEPIQGEVREKVEMKSTSAQPARLTQEGALGARWQCDTKLRTRTRML